VHVHIVMGRFEGFDNGIKLIEADTIQRLVSENGSLVPFDNFT
jgi:hypothetical protein